METTVDLITPPRDTQDAFNRVWQWFVVEGHPMSVSLGECKYRTPEGNRCAAGVLIPDALYSPSMEGNRISSLLLYPEISKHLRHVADSVLHALQHAHDAFSPSNPPFAELIPIRLRAVAERHGLTVPSEVA